MKHWIVVVLLALLAVSFPVSAQYTDYIGCIAEKANDTQARGSVTINDRVVWTDTCINPSQLQKGRCDEKRVNRYKVSTVECDGGCFEGACLTHPETRRVTHSPPTIFFVPYISVKPANKTVTEDDPGLGSNAAPGMQPVPFTLVKNHGFVCIDYDGGFNPASRGEVTLNGRRVWLDTCIDPSELQEGTCDIHKRSLYRATVVECENGCFEGRCLE